MFVLTVTESGSGHFDQSIIAIADGPLAVNNSQWALLPWDDSKERDGRSSETHNIIGARATVTCLH